MFAAAVACLTFAVVTAFHPGFLAPAETVRWIVITAGAPLLWCFAPSPRIDPAIRRCGLAFLAWAALTLVWTPAFLDGVEAMVHWLALGAVFALGAALARLDGVLIAIALGAAVNGFVAFSQSFVNVPPIGLLANRNLLAEIGLFGTLAALCLARRWWPLLLLPLTVTALAAATWPPIHKTVIVGAGMAVLALAIRGRRYVLAGFGGLAVAAAVMAVAWTTGRMTSLTYRIAVWQDTIAGLTPWGRGVGSFAVVFQGLSDETQGDLLTSTRLVAVAYNDLLTTALETGLAALLPAGIAAVALWRGIVHDGDRAAYLVFAAWLGLGLVNYPLHAPASAFIGALVAGYLCRDRDRLCDRTVGGGEPP